MIVVLGGNPLVAIKGDKNYFAANLQHLFAICKDFGIFSKKIFFDNIMPELSCNSKINRKFAEI